MASRGRKSFRTFCPQSRLTQKRATKPTTVGYKPCLPDSDVVYECRAAVKWPTNKLTISTQEGRSCAICRATSNSVEYISTLSRCRYLGPLGSLFAWWPETYRVDSIPGMKLSSQINRMVWYTTKIRGRQQKWTDDLKRDQYLLLRENFVRQQIKVASRQTMPCRHRQSMT